MSGYPNKYTRKYTYDQNDSSSMYGIFGNDPRYANRFKKNSEYQNDFSYNQNNYEHNPSPYSQKYTSNLKNNVTNYYQIYGNNQYDNLNSSNDRYKNSFQYNSNNNDYSRDNKSSNYYNSKDQDYDYKSYSKSKDQDYDYKSYSKSKDQDNDYKSYSKSKDQDYDYKSYSKSKDQDYDYKSYSKSKNQDYDYKSYSKSKNQDYDDENYDDSISYSSYSKSHASRQKSYDSSSLTRSSLKGIRNLGNTCFINSTLQILLNLPQFISDLFDSLSNVEQKRNSLIKELCQIFYDYSTTTDRCIRINSFYSLLKNKISALTDGGQHDVAEFFQLLSESCENEILGSILSSKKNESNGEPLFSKRKMLANDPFTKNFGYSTISNLECGICGKKLTNEVQTNFMLHLPLVSSSVEDCLAKSFERERIETNSKPSEYRYDRYYRRTQPKSEGYVCSDCQNRTEFYLCTSLYRIPRFLIVQIERFDSSLVKNDMPIHPPDRIDLSRYLNSEYFAAPSPIRVTNNEEVNTDNLNGYGGYSSVRYSSGAASNCSSINEDEDLKRKTSFPNASYKLVGIILHSGSFSFGHYTAAIAAKYGRWSVISDETVFEDSSFDPSAPYCLVYQID